MVIEKRFEGRRWEIGFAKMFKILEENAIKDKILHKIDVIDCVIDQKIGQIRKLKGKAHQIVVEFYFL